MTEKRRREIAKSIVPNRANFLHIINSQEQTINGTLLIDIEKAMQLYADECVQVCKRQKIELQKQLTEQNKAITTSFKGA